jgi:hypothetical protein
MAGELKRQRGRRFSHATTQRVRLGLDTSVSKRRPIVVEH